MGFHEDKYLTTNISVITNFGCKSDCWYCIWKGHKLENIKLNTDWNKLKNFLFKHKEKGKVSVSGGGDCLHEFETYREWWDKFFVLTNELSMLVDVHSREKFVDDKFWKKINKTVFSSDKLEDDIDYLKYLSERVKFRITHLVTANTTYQMIDDYLEFQKKYNCQFTIKELVGYDDDGMYKKILKKFPNMFHLDAGDYNIYYMPDNTIKDKFLF